VFSRQCHFTPWLLAILAFGSLFWFIGAAQAQGVRVLSRAPALENSEENLALRRDFALPAPTAASSLERLAQGAERRSNGRTGMAQTRFWTEMTWTDFQASDMQNTIAVLPVAAVEQHGPHLPLGVDSIVMDFYLRRAADRLPEDLAVLFLPVQTIGASSEHSEFPGTLTLAPATAARAWTEIGESVHRAGVRKLVILSSHGGNMSVIDGVARDLRVRLGMLCVNASWRRFGYPDGLFDADELAHGIHAGDIETSLMLAARGDLVRSESIEDFPSAGRDIERDFTWLRAGSPIAFAWMAQDLHELGAMGNAAHASPEKGEAAADYGVTAFIELLQDVEAFDLARLARGPV
jgi:creatinine amidohydrolase